MSRTVTRSALRNVMIAAAAGVPALAALVVPPTVWSEVTGLPGHPLVVHAAVVMVPVSAIISGLAVFRPALRGRLRRSLPPLLAITATLVVVAKRTGDSLAAAVGLPVTHAEWGNNLVPLAIGLAVGTTLLLRVDVGTDRISRRVAPVVAGLVGIASVAAVGMTVVVGHSGAEATWAGTLEEARRPPATAGVVDPIPMAEVARRATPDACWTVVDGSVYDLTGFIARHPAGSSAILEMCGRDATEDYREEHEGQVEPADWLAVFRIGELAGP